MPTAILIDGEFFLRRYRNMFGNQPPDRVARELHKMCLGHLFQEGKRRPLYRIFFYDCPPLKKTVHHPLTDEPLDFSETPTALWRRSFLDEMRRLRKVALRLGYMNERGGGWSMHPQAMKDLIAGELAAEDLSEQDFRYEAERKGIEMRMGLDIASIAFKKQADQIILVAGESDFVPAAKLARREGIDFILDPMWASIRDDLHEHVDGLRTIVGRKDDQMQGGGTGGNHYNGGLPPLPHQPGEEEEEEENPYHSSER